MGTWLAALALAFQIFIVQTHVDFAPYAGASPGWEQSFAAAPRVVADAGHQQGQAPCLICQELALTGAFLHAAPPALVLVEHALTLAAPALRTEDVRAFPAHSWQSRAPPSSL